MVKEIGTIYMITNLINNKQYIGQTIRKPSVRFAEHLSVSQKSNYMAVHRAIKKYGSKNFQFSILEQCPQELLDEKETYYIKKYNTFNEGYNSTLGGQKGNKLFIDSKEMIKIYHKLKSARKVAAIYQVDKDCICNRLKKLGIPFYSKADQLNQKIKVFHKNQLIKCFKTKRECAGWFIKNKISKSCQIESVRKSIKNTDSYYGYKIVIDNKI